MPRRADGWFPCRKRSKRHDRISHGARELQPHPVGQSVPTWAWVGPAYFKVWTKSGQILWYGLKVSEANEYVAAQDAVLRTYANYSLETGRVWALYRIEDRLGNLSSSTTTPATNTARCAPSVIRYTANPCTGVAPANRIQFSYEAGARMRRSRTTREGKAFTTRCASRPSSRARMEVRSGATPSATGLPSKRPLHPAIRAGVLGGRAALPQSHDIPIHRGRRRREHVQFRLERMARTCPRRSFKAMTTGALRSPWISTATARRIW